MARRTEPRPSGAKPASVDVRPRDSALLPDRSVAWAWILGVTVVAALLRFVGLGWSPPGLNQDEAINAWNTWCLLKTGHDMTGTSWPIFYSHAIGDNRTTLFFYMLMPFQALFGLSAWSTRLPAAFFGTLAVPLVGYVASRWWGRWAGPVAAALLALDWWHLFMSRWGIEGSVTPFLALLPLALATAAGLLPGEREATFRWPWALAAGVAAGIATYGYWSMRLFIPAWILVTVLLGGPALWRAWFGPGRLTVLAAVAGFAATFGPLVWRHLVDPAIAQRATMTRLWEPGTPVFEIARRVAGRWILHFDPRFFFTRGDSYELLRPPIDGAMHWFMLPLFLIGLVALVWRVRREPAVRALAALVIAYPAGDLLAKYDGVHSLRSAAGIGGLILLATFGAIAAWEWMVARGRVRARGVALTFAGVALILTFRCLRIFYGEYNDRLDIFRRFYTELTQASAWVRPRFDEAAAVICTTKFTNEPWAILLVGLAYDPKRWFAEPREKIQVRGWEDYRRVGKIRFIYDETTQRAVEALQANGKPDRVFFIVRPGELGLKDPVAVFTNQGAEILWICDVTL